LAQFEVEKMKYAREGARRREIRWLLEHKPSTSRIPNFPTTSSHQPNILITRDWRGMNKTPKRSHSEFLEASATAIDLVNVWAGSQQFQIDEDGDEVVVSVDLSGQNGVWLAKDCKVVEDERSLYTIYKERFVNPCCPMLFMIKANKLGPLASVISCKWSINMTAMRLT
jgi:hypothetical protein